MADNVIQAMNEGILDHAYTISFGKLHEFLCSTDKRQIKRAALFGSRPPPNDGIWQYAKKAGFELHLEDCNYANKEKKIDTGIATLLTIVERHVDPWRWSSCYPISQREDASI